MDDNIGCLAKGGITIVILIMVVCICGFSFFNKHIFGNKTIIDFKYDFKYAYIEENGETKRIEVDTWKDWKDSDAIQVVDRSGRVYYTHLNRVVLSNR